MVNNDYYPELRKIDGCATLIDLLATPRDCKEMRKFAHGVRVPHRNIISDMNPTVKELNESYKRLRDASIKLTREGKPHVVFAYFGGHGASLREK